MTDEEYDRLRWSVYHDTVKRLSWVGGLSRPQVERVHADLLTIFASVPADCEDSRTKLLDQICEGLARAHSVPDFAPEEFA
jgi:hypothetical protein